MEPIEWAQVLSYVRPEGNQRRTWPAAMVVLIRLAGWDGGGELTGPEVASMAGVSDAAGRRMMLALERANIVKRTQGAKLKWCELNPDWRRWRVAWAIPPAAIEAQLALGRQERAQNVIERFSARSYGARSWDRIGRSESARNRVLEVLEADRCARSKDGASARTDRAPMSARIVRRAETALGRADRQRAPQQFSPGVDGDLTAALEVQPISQQQREKDLGAGGLCAAIVRASVPAPGYNRKFLNGDHLRRLLDLVEQEGLAAIEALFRAIEGEFSPIGYVEELERCVADQGLAPAAPAAEEPSPRTFYEPPGPDPEAIDPREGIRLVRQGLSEGAWHNGDDDTGPSEAIAQ